MIEGFYYSIAGRKPHQEIDDLIQGLLDSEYVPSPEKKVLRHIQQVAKNGSYPSKEYFSQFYQQGGFLSRSLSEIKTYCASVIDVYHRQEIEKRVITAINESDDTNTLIAKLQGISESSATTDTSALDDVIPRTYGSQKGEKLQKGIASGINEIDEVTNGFQPGTVAVICAFTGHGKSTCVESILFKNALEGNPCCLFSLEMAPDIIWSQLEARYMNQVKGLQVTAQDMIFHKVPSDIEEKIIQYEEDFTNEICKNLIVLDESYISKQVMLNYKSLSALMRTVASKLGGLKLVAFDHVGQFELMFPDCGNKIIKSIQSFTKTFIDQNGDRPVSMLAVQTNRQGEMRARKRSGVYDMQAISELNECERTASYVMFMYTSDDMKIMQETKITLSKNRLGAVVTEPIVSTFNPSIITVGATIESVSMSDEEFNDMDLDLGNDFDSF